MYKLYLFQNLNVIYDETINKYRLFTCGNRFNYTEHIICDEYTLARYYGKDYYKVEVEQ